MAAITAGAGLSRDVGAAVAVGGGYALSALGYGFVSGFSRSLGAKAAGVRNLRYRDGKPMGPLQTRFRSYVVADSRHR